MSEAPFDMLEHVKASLGQAGNDYINPVLQPYIDEVREFLHDAGIPETVTNTRPFGGIVARGVADLWNFGAGDADLSPYFRMRAAQLALKWGVVTNEQS